MPASLRELKLQFRPQRLMSFSGPRPLRQTPLMLMRALCGLLQPTFKNLAKHRLALQGRLRVAPKPAIAWGMAAKCVRVPQGLRAISGAARWKKEGPMKQGQRHCRLLPKQSSGGLGLPSARIQNTKVGHCGCSGHCGCCRALGSALTSPASRRALRGAPQSAEAKASSKPETVKHNFWAPPGVGGYDIRYSHTVILYHTLLKQSTLSCNVL